MLHIAKQELGLNEVVLIRTKSFRLPEKTVTIDQSRPGGKIVTKGSHARCRQWESVAGVK